MQSEKEAWFSIRNLKLLSAPLGNDNPITVQVLGICSALAVTVKLQPALVMALSVIVVSSLSSLIISLLRNTIPPRIRIIVQLLVIATLVVLVDMLLKAFMYDVSKQLSVFVGLIITNCIVMGRLEAFAMVNPPWKSLLDGIGNGVGYGLILVVVGFVRELFGTGCILGYKVIPESFYDLGYSDNGFFILPPMALILLGIIIWIQRSFKKELRES